MLTLNVYDRLLFIKASQFGTAFLLDVNGRQYIVTARHLVAEDTDSIQYFRANQWIDLPVAYVGRGRGDADVVVLAASISLVSADMPLPSTPKFIVGEDVFFAGFPMQQYLAFEATQARPIGFAKKGCIAGGTPRRDGAQTIYVDAINNEGLSGGPLLNYDAVTKCWNVIGVVSGFQTAREMVIDKDGQETGSYILTNTGLLVAYGILHALEIIDSNPIGVPLSRP